MIILLAGFFILACYFFGDCRNWRSYYPTILFLIAGDLIYLYVTSAKPLWLYTPTLISGTIATLIVALVIYPCTILIFLPTYPKSGALKKTGYIMGWVCLYAILEYLGLMYNYMQHFNGWNFVHSVLFDFALFPLLLIHHRNPSVAWLLAVIIGFGISFIFKLPAPY